MSSLRRKRRSRILKFLERLVFSTTIDVSILQMVCEQRDEKYWKAKMFDFVNKINEIVKVTEVDY